MKLHYPYLFIFFMAFAIGCNDMQPLKKTSTASIDSSIEQAKALGYNSPDSAVAITQSLLVKSQQLNYEKGMLNSRLLLLSIQGLKGNFDSAISMGKQLQLQFNKSTPANIVAELDNEMGIAYDYKSQYKQALEHYNKALAFFVQQNDNKGILRLKNNIGLVYQNLKEDAKAKSIFEEVVANSQQQHLEEQEMMGLNNLAAVEMEMKQYPQALVHFRKVLFYDLASGNETYISYSYHNMGECFKNMRQFDSGQYYLQKAIALKEKLEAKAPLINSYKCYGELLMDMGNHAAALVYINKALALSNETGTEDYKQQTMFLQARLYKMAGKFEQALHYTDSASAIKDSIADASFKHDFLLKEQENQIAQQQLEIERQQRALEAKRFYLVIGAMAFAVLLSFSIWQYMARRKQHHVNQKLQQQKQQIEQGLETKSQLLSFMAHEIRNPLTSLIGLNHLLLEESPTTQQKEMLEYQLHSSEHLLELLNTVLDHQKIAHGNIQLKMLRFNLKDVLQRVYELYKSAIITKQLNYQLNFDERIPNQLMGDPVRMAQVFGNLIFNATKFTNNGDSIFVTVALVREDAQQCTLYCSIKDTGIGIAKEEQERIFELYVQSSSNKAEQLGTGLGLGIVRNLLTLMNSHIELESQPKQGSTFSFQLMLQKG